MHSNRSGSVRYKSEGAGNRQDHGQFEGAGAPSLVKPHLDQGRGEDGFP